MPTTDPALLELVFVGLTFLVGLICIGAGFLATSGRMFIGYRILVLRGILMATSLCAIMLLGLYGLFSFLPRVGDPYTILVLFGIGIVLLLLAGGLSAGACLAAKQWGWLRGTLVEAATPTVFAITGVAYDWTQLSALHTITQIIGLAVLPLAPLISVFYCGHLLPEEFRIRVNVAKQVNKREAFERQVAAVLSAPIREALHLRFAAGEDPTALITLGGGQTGWLAASEKGNRWELHLPDGTHQTIASDEQALTAAVGAWSPAVRSTM